MDMMTKKLSDNFKNLFQDKIIHCKTKQKSIILLSILESFDFKWCDEKLPTSDLARTYGEATCYHLIREEDCDRIRYSPLDWYQEEYPDCTILEFDDFIGQYRQLLIDITGGLSYDYK